MICNKKYRTDEWIIDIYIHIIILLIILSIAFWKIISKTEVKSIQGEVKNQISNVLSKNVATGQTKTAMSSIPYDKLLKIYNGKPSKNIEDHNNSLLRLNITIICVLIITFVILWTVLSINCGKCIPVGKIFIENIGLFVLIGVIEVLFFINIASKYVPVKPSFMVNTVLNHFKQD